MKLEACANREGLDQHVNKKSKRLPLETKNTHTHKKKKKKKKKKKTKIGDMGPVVQSVVSLTSSLVVKMLTVLVSKILIHRYFC